MSTITNQTLTLTITSGTVETVIRKDNCRIDTFGDYVRLTDYTGERYEFLYSDVSSPSSTSATDLAETLEGYLNTGGGGGGGGVESVTGDLVDDTDPLNPVVNLPYLFFEALLTQTGTSAPTVTILHNTTGITFSAVYDDVGIYFLEPDTVPDPEKVAVNGATGSSAGFANMFWRDDKLNVATRDGSNSPLNGVLSNSSVEIRIYP